ncbi:centromere protein O [Tympanuchus pallidicinctus]|uniref:centromere protein O n=1 Tax=Tympanuchus pallidicinctus TaxID=109042 RepID=UPI0022874C06|nr:centromere protein O [Tympanuchus pallidicinctus]XP_052549313.1 centromere protein O [Tympanuchus pallidicinctus]XP_052549322.1 centromere protein O [Tympanuchus pallidicinctus]
MEEGRDGDGKENAMHGRSLTAASQDGGGRMSAVPLAQGKVEGGKVYSGDGVLGYLEMLEAQAHELGLKQEEKEQQEKKLNRLKARVQELRTRRDELQAKVELQEKRLLDKEGVVTDPARPSAQTVLEWKVKSIKAMLQVFYLTGISGKLTKQGVCFCISTAYEGTYLDSYYVDLLIKPEVKIQRHSVPIFIPLEQIAKKYLQTDIRRFLSVLWEHLNAYVGRRHQADQLEERFSDHIEGTLQRNSLCNLLVFNYTVSSDSKTFPFNVRLLYGDLCCSLPTEAIISCTPGTLPLLAKMAAAHSNAFRQTALHKAFDSIINAKESLD